MRIYDEYFRKTDEQKINFTQNFVIYLQIFVTSYDYETLSTKVTKKTFR